MTVLIVDDNAGIRRVVRRNLSSAVHAVWECSDGLGALAAFQEYRPDVVLMDIQMPGMDGLTATRQIRNLDPSACIVIVTDHDDDDLRQAAVEAGASDYLLKQDLMNLPDVLSNLPGK
jgi:CheY-like chemotaxis protein